MPKSLVLILIIACIFGVVIGSLYAADKYFKHLEKEKK